MSTNPTPTPLRILLLHGYTQSPPLFAAKTGALQKSLHRTFPSPHYTLSLTYARAPHRIPAADIPGHPSPSSQSTEAYGWWRRKDLDNGEIVYEGLEEGLATIARYIRAEGPFDGVIGFSQGAAAAAMVASLLEGPHRVSAFYSAHGGIPYPNSFLDAKEGEQKPIQPPLNFAICYSGFRAPGKRYAAFYAPRISTPVLHVLGQVDVVVDEGRGRELVGACEGGEGRVLVHPGGHFVPCQRVWLEGIVGWVRRVVEGDEGGKGKRGGKGAEVGVEDMDVPF